MEIIDFTIQNNDFNGIITDNKDNIIDIIKNNNIVKTAVIKEDYFNNLFLNKVYEWMYYEIRRKRLVLKNPKKKINDSLKIVGLNQTYLNKNINKLSSSEKIWITIAISLLSNPDIIIFEDIFKYFDKENEKKLILLLRKIKDNYNKTIVFITNDSELLYKYTNHLIIVKNNKLIEEGNTDKVFKRVDFLNKNNISIPEIVELTYMIKKKKKIKLEYHKDVRDILKDIYKHI